MIELQNLSKFYYSDSSVTVALKKINLKLPDRGLVAVTGESGSGKTTLLNVISGELSYDEGEMLVDGEPTFQYSEEEWEQYRKEKIGFIYQDYSLLMDYTAFDNVLSVMVILGVGLEEARQRAESYLEKVGLNKLSSKKARQLSSGQKQRLSIARALAKEADIIVADEPTGNLDSETGEQIIRLLKEISKERLVLLVTHNYAQAEPYADRKIRIFDGEIVDDKALNPKEAGKAKATQAKKEETDEEKSNAHTIKYFVKKNIFSRPAKLVFYQVFFLLTAIVSFVCLGDFLTRLDEADSMVYNSDYFQNDERTRLIVCRDDGGEITSDDMEKISDTRDVVSVDKYDYVQDINYYAVLDADYELKMGWEEDVLPTPEFMDKTHFMRSMSSVEDKYIKEGEGAEALFDIVVSGDYGLKVGDGLTIYLTSKMWGAQEYYCKDFTVTGITDKEEGQIYFSDKFSKMIGASLYGMSGTLSFSFDDKTAEPKKSKSFFFVMTDEIDNSLLDYPHETEIGLCRKEIIKSGIAQLSGMILYSGVYYEDEMEIWPYALLKAQGESLYVDISETTSKSSIRFVEISVEMFEEIYNHDSTQATAYIDNYARADKVIKRLEKQGFKVASSYRLGRYKYDDEKVYDRFSGIIIAVVILVVLIVFEVLLVGFAVRMSRGDYKILRSIGMERKNVKKLVFRELFVYSAAAVIFVATASQVAMLLFKKSILADTSQIASYISNLLYYFSLPSMLFYIAYNLFALWLTSLVANLFVNGGKKI